MGKYEMHILMKSCWFLPVRLLWIACMLCVPQFVVAQQSTGECDVALKKETYVSFLLSINRSEVTQIQSALNKTGVSQLVTDGLFGQATRTALYQFCLKLENVPESDLAVNLVQALEQQVLLMEDEALTPNVSTESTKKLPAVVNTKLTEESTGDLPGIYYLLREEDLAAVTAAKTAAAIKNTKGENSDESVAKDNAAQEIKWPSDEEMASLETITTIPYVNQAQFRSAVMSIKVIDQEKYPEFITLLTDAAKKKASTKLEPIVLDDTGCGCVRDFSNMIYGFYPYWRSTVDRQSDAVEDDVATAVVVPAIDYSVFTRIAYYALTLEENGDITTPLHWNTGGKLGNFINNAHRHKTKVDLVVYSDHWAQWSESSLKRSVMSVYNQLRLEVEYKEGGLMQYVPLLNSTTASPDGVTLYFDGYFDHVESSYKIIEFIRQLYERLEDLEADYKINILLDVDSTELASSKPIFNSIKNLLVNDKNDNPAYVDGLLVFLNEPTTTSKKILRSKIENEFSGAERMAVLRKVIPIITPYKHDNDELGPYTQFDDDLIYLKNNFSGVALWPLPMVADADAAMISQRLIKYFGVSDVEGLLNTISARYPALCEYGCPNRWLFRLAIDVLLFFLITYAVLALFSSRVRRFYSKYSVYFILYIIVMIVVFMVSLMCDSFWKQKRDTVLLGSILIIAAFFMVRKYSRVKQGPLP
ncbi:hypothetical protein MNBD_GAMMA16-1532 [hydrothermal vent metagenome]|uniref:Uncharacterized protein n=1 Tax=hydrothermal vent metagenome TaxID=652676 RepID=A0A3B0YVY8_9ZZZZ